MASRECFEPMDALVDADTDYRGNWPDDPHHIHLCFSECILRRACLISGPVRCCKPRCAIQLNGTYVDGEAALPVPRRQQSILPVPRRQQSILPVPRRQQSPEFIQITEEDPTSNANVAPSGTDEPLSQPRDTVRDSLPLSGISDTAFSRFLRYHKWYGRFWPGNVRHLWR